MMLIVFDQNVQQIKNESTYLWTLKKEEGDVQHTQKQEEIVLHNSNNNNRITITIIIMMMMMMMMMMMIKCFYSASILKVQRCVTRITK